MKGFRNITIFINEKTLRACEYWSNIAGFFLNPIAISTYSGL